VSHSSCRGDRCDDRVELFAVLSLEGTDRIKVFDLISPLLFLELPSRIDVRLRKVGAEKIGEVGNGWFSRLGENLVDILQRARQSTV
jgi:hypothetical protein